MTEDEIDRMIYAKEQAQESLTSEIAAAGRVARAAAGLPAPERIRRKRSPVPARWTGSAQEWHELNDDPEAWF